MASKRKRGVTNFYKKIIIQVYGYLALIPFIFAFFSLIKRNNLLDIVIYSAGVIFIFTLLLINHLEPLIKITPGRIILFSIDRNKPVILLRKDLKDIYRINNNTARLSFKDNHYEIRLGKKKLDLLFSILKEQN